jgi:4-phytase / acid phosphatase
MRILLAAALLFNAAPAYASPYRVERVAMLMRHGVRPPTKAPSMPAGIAAAPWPGWSTAPGELTRHGADAVRLLGAADRRFFARDHLLPAQGCPAAAVTVLSDSDQRTIATGDAWAQGFAPGCRIDHVHRLQDESDPLFAPIESGLVGFDPAAADAAVAGALPSGGIAALEAKVRPALQRLDDILCNMPVASGCGVGGAASGIRSAGPTGRPKLTGALDRGSTAAQILLLEYAEGKPASEVGWGRATAGDIARLGVLHATEFAVLARPLYIATRNLAPIALRLRAALAPTTNTKLTVIVGHDTNIANFGGLLDVHWQIPGFAADDPVPGGALIATVLRTPGGARFVQLTYRAQPLDAIRHLRPGMTTTVLHIPGCDPQGDGLCPAPDFDRLLAASATLVKR